uniref:Uncharacterized protein n=1 Tax=Setaria viridis TaxID=4556 RepID=A0A4U6TTF5_SETVI|nr:hypothetical protein SEVIR_8G145933v2 [Setaria viridis]
MCAPAGTASFAGSWRRRRFAGRRGLNEERRERRGALRRYRASLHHESGWGTRAPLRNGGGARPVRRSAGAPRPSPR